MLTIVKHINQLSNYCQFPCHVEQLTCWLLKQLCHMTDIKRHLRRGAIRATLNAMTRHNNKRLT